MQLKVLHDEDMAAAILDRVLERGRFVHLDGPSGRTRALPSLPQVLVENGLPEIAPLSQGETVMLEKKKLHAFYRELQVPCRVEAATGSPQVKESEENAKAQLTQS